VIDYPGLKRQLNRRMFGIKLNDTTNACKAYRAIVIECCRSISIGLSNCH